MPMPVAAKTEVLGCYVSYFGGHAVDDALSSSVMDFRSPTEGDGTGPLVYSLTSISLLLFLSSNLFYLPPLLFPSSPSTSPYRPSPSLHGTHPVTFTAPPFIHHTLAPFHIAPFLRRSRFSVHWSHNSKHSTQSALHRPPLQ